MSRMMSRIVLIVNTLICLAGISPAADFSPTVMTLTCPEAVEYFFDGDPLTIPFTIEGVGGAVWLVINTKGQAENIRDVRNGNLGWHYVHKIDTTVYISQRYERDKGSAEIVWDGRNQDGNLVEPGEYDYYLWAYDDMSGKKLASGVVPIGFRTNHQAAQIYEYDESGMPRPRPLIMGTWNRMAFYDDPVPHKRFGTHFKWEIGADPLDLNSLQTTICSMYYPRQPSTIIIDDEMVLNPDYVEYGSPVWDPTDYSVFYHPSYRVIPVLLEDGTWGGYWEFTLFKWEFIPDGEAVLDQEWFDWEEASWKWQGTSKNVPNCSTDGNYIYFTRPSRMVLFEENNYLYCMDLDGDMVFEKTMHDWYFPEEIQNNEVNCSIDKLYIRPHNRLFMLGIDCCLHQLIRTNRLLEDPDDETDMVVFENRNGDYFLDNGYEPDARLAWFCIRDREQRPSRYRTSVCIDSNDFNIFYTGGFSGVSIAVSTQDGTGIDYMAFADEQTLTDDMWQLGGLLCDTGSNYDGLYMGGTYRNLEGGNRLDAMSTHFIAFDSCHGVITYDTAAEEETPAAFCVEQNIPNPFNPTTTIAFTIPEASQVQVAVYNVAGQKVATLADDFMAAGKHVVTWDAADFSAGVYFCRVKAGGYEKTVKMTMVK